ncbi:MAG TPA: response regulator [Candidatus Paenibacillus intestinavium]|nr:response regulator [Candidatus Paenibacillus intestinavium]
MWKVIIVEDEIFVRESVKELINWGELGFQLVGEAGDGLQALELMEKEKPDVVITDIIMPKLNGLELLQESRKRAYKSKFVMLTCMGEFEYVRQAMEYGAANYILKLSMSVNDLRKILTTISRELAESNITKEEVELPTNTIKINHPEINKIIAYIEEYYDKDITVKSLAQYVMMGENYISALFKKKLGQNLIHYLHEFRINKSKELLLQSDLAVGEVGVRVGFMNDNYFIKIFKRFTGTTPSQFRTEQRR